jgi:hypothetical protein
MEEEEGLSYRWRERGVGALGVARSRSQLEQGGVLCCCSCSCSSAVLVKREGPAPAGDSVIARGGQRGGEWHQSGSGGGWVIAVFPVAATHRF